VLSAGLKSTAEILIHVSRKAGLGVNADKTEHASMPRNQNVP
jgi:hypothetical protein